MAALAALSLAACSSGAGDFIGSRVLDSCNESWSACTTTVGCILGEESYAQGSFPSEFEFLVELTEPANVTLSFYLSNATAAGQQTTLIFYEGGCRSYTRDDIVGQDFLTESQTQGAVTRTAQLNDIGDHLIDIQSDARADYLVKVDLVPVRAQ